jgi:hypothetical protein
MYNIHTFFFTCLLFFLAGWLPSALDVRYKKDDASSNSTREYRGGGPSRLTTTMGEYRKNASRKLLITTIGTEGGVVSGIDIVIR